MQTIHFSEVQEQLGQWRNTVLAQLKDPASRPDALRLKIEIEQAMACLGFCERHQIQPNARAVHLPEPKTQSPSSEYRIVEDQETDQREHWIEVSLEGTPLRPSPGTLLVLDHQ